MIRFILAAFALLIAAPAAAASPPISVGPASVTEGGRLYFPICATSTAPRTTYSQVYLETHSGTALPGKDYVYERVKLSLKPTVQCIKGMVQTIDNANLDGTRSMHVQITAVRYAAIGTGEATGTILDNEIALPALSVQSLSVDENAGSVTVHVTRSGALTSSSSFGYATQDVTAIGGINYTARSGTGTFAPGQSDWSFTVPVLDDGKVQGDLVFNVLLSGLSNATLGSNGSVTIRNTDVAPPPTQTCPDGSVIPATSVCPPPPPPPPPPAGKALALQACPALNRPESIVAGNLYDVMGFAGYSRPGDPPPPPGTQDIVILSDATHPGDGWFSLYVPAGCVTFG